MATLRRANYFPVVRTYRMGKTLTEIQYRRQKALERLIAWRFRRGYGVVEIGWSGHARRPGNGHDALHDSASLARLLAARAFGFGIEISFTPC